MPIDNEVVSQEVPSAEPELSFDDAAKQAIASEGIETPESNDGDEAVSEEESSQEVKPEESLKEQDFDSIDPNKLPAEIQKFYKGMQGSFTKKMQALQQAMDSLNPHKERLALVDRALQGDKEAQAVLGRIAGNGAPAPAPLPDQEPFYRDVPKAFDNTRGLVEYLDKRFGGFLQTYVNQMIPQIVQQQVAPAMAPLQQMQEQTARNGVLAEVNRLKTAYPDFETKAAQMIELKKANPGLNMEQAYKLAAFRNPTAPSKIVSRPGVRPASVDSTAKIGSWDDAAKEALRILKARK